jgi:histidyl-tRNA synthetase
MTGIFYGYFSIRGFIAGGGDYDVLGQNFGNKAELLMAVKRGN